MAKIKYEEPKKKAPVMPVYASKEVLYNMAVAKMEMDPVIVQHQYRIDNYELAASMFEELEDYEDAPQKAQECHEKAEEARAAQKEHTYELAVVHEKMAEERKGLEAEGTWKKVAADYKALGDYKDCKERLSRCEEVLKKANRKHRNHRIAALAVVAAVAAAATVTVTSNFYRYILGRAYLIAGMQTEAVATFEKVPGMLDADELSEKCQMDQLAQAQVGDTIYYGTYHWKVLNIDDKEQNMLAIVSGVDEESPFYSVPFNESQNDVTWENSSMRKWLNSDIYTEAFSDGNRQHLLTQTSGPSSNAAYGTSYDKETKDYLTILTADQCSKYTEVLETLGLNYWLRTPGNNMGTAAYMSASRHTPMTYGYPVSSKEMAVRPVILIDLSWMEE